MSPTVDVELLNTPLPCKEPCSSPCSEPCSEPCDDGPNLLDDPFAPREGMALLPRIIHTGFYNALKIAFDELPYEPKTILHIGGCRQREFARYLGFLLPATEIFVLDPNPEEARIAQEEICCRFKFVSAKVEDLSMFPNNYFDLTLAHHGFEYIENWESSMDEIGRVTKSHLLLTRPRLLLWKLLNVFSSIREAFAEQRLSWPKKDVTKNQLFGQIRRYGKIGNQTAPWPWQMLMVAMKPIKEERLILADPKGSHEANP